MFLFPFHHEGHIDQSLSPSPSPPSGWRCCLAEVEDEMLLRESVRFRSSEGRALDDREPAEDPRRDMLGREPIPGNELRDGREDMLGRVGMLGILGMLGKYRDSWDDVDDDDASALFCCLFDEEDSVGRVSKSVMVR